MNNHIIKSLIILFSVSLCSRSFSQERLPQLFINEFLASNSETNLSNDFHEYTDWLEIYNAEDTTVNLSGFYLTDDLSEPQKWQIPSRSLVPAAGYILFWLDDRNIGRHANFKLAAEGEQLGLYHLGKFIDSVSFSEQLTDISFGRHPDGAGDWTFYESPTPGAANDAMGYQGRTEEPEFSIPGGFYHGTQAIEFRQNDPDEIIRYTLDGSLPVQASPIYSSPLVIDSTTVLRAQAQRPGYLASNVVTHTYFIDERIILPVVSIATNPANLWDDTIGIYVIGTNGIPGYCVNEPRNWNQPWERPIHLELYEADGTLGFEMNAGMRIGGGCTRKYPQKPLAIYTRSEYGTSMIDYQIFSDKPIRLFNNISLRNSGQDWYRAMCRDGMMHTLVKDRMNIDWLAYKPAVLFLNGAYWGLHDIREKHNEHYLASNYGIDPDKIDILSGNAAVEQGSAKLYHDMIRFIETHDMSAAENYNWVGTQMDIDAYLDYVIAEIYFANIDWPAGNIEYWRQQGESHKWRWILFDTDLGFGAHNLGQYHSNTLENATAKTATYYANPPWSTLLLRKLLENATFRNEFIQRFATHLNLTFHPQRVIHIIDSLKTQIEAEIPRHIRKWSESTSFNGGWNYHIDVMREFAARRPAHVINHLIGKFGLSGSVQLTVNSNAPDRGQVFINGISLPKDSFTGTYLKDIPIPCEARQAHGCRFIGWQGASNSSLDSIAIFLTENDTLTALFEPDESKIFHGLRINEIMALNESTIADEQGEYEDWIELYNDSQHAIDIGGMYVTDRLNNLSKWQIPATAPDLTTIQPGGFLLLWADNSPEQGVLHLNIQLSGDGEEIGLSKQTDDGMVLIDQLTFGSQSTDVSYGRSPDGADSYTFFQKPTPGNVNAVIGIADDDTFLPKHSRLNHNYPNPFNAFTLISYELQKDNRVKLTIYDVSGRKVRTLVDEHQHAGNYTVTLHATDMASGIYFCRLTLGSFEQSRKILLLR